MGVPGFLRLVGKSRNSPCPRISRPRVSQDPRKADELERWLDQIANSYQVLSMDAASFREWGRLMHQRPDHRLEDAMIAATARVHGLTVVTRNERDFSQFGVRSLNPFRTV